MIDFVNFNQTARNMNKIVVPLLMAVMLLLISCRKDESTDLSVNSIIPGPLKVVPYGGAFVINSHTRIIPGEGGQELTRLAGQLASLIGSVSGIDAEIKANPGLLKRNMICFSLTEEVQHDEGYVMEIDKRQLSLEASTTEGLFRGIQTLAQLLTLEGSDVQIRREEKILLPTGIIEDRPEYPYRGTMLDVSRHFFPVDVVKQHIDHISLYKINHLHLHLSDDQGWRIEIKSWPRLTQIGGSTEVGGGEGGYYTQDEYAELVAYAAEKYITIVPEIDMPGHTNAALASYAELNCNDRVTELYTGTRVGFSTLCTEKEITYQFIEDVVGEICSLTPGPYFHIGGDESHVTPQDEYVDFINRVKKIVRGHGKQVMGWDEISHASLEHGDIAQYWASEDNAKRALDKGAKILLSPAKHCYLDMKYDSSTHLGLNWAAFIEVDDAYQWKPESLVEGLDRSHILGVESPLWAETIESLEDIEYLAFPRLIGHAEIGWCNGDSLHWNDYRRRLFNHGKLLDHLGINYYRSALVW